jgi:4-amino-4-deoxy-L-arabinose transferase-like glycosyltransferase
MRTGDDIDRCAGISQPSLHTGEIRTTRLLAVVGVCALTLFAGLGRAALWEPDEARYAEATRQMLARGDILTPWYNGEPRFEKPILFYWMQLPFVAALGSTELAARLPAALSASGCVVLTWLIGARLFGATAAWLAALVLATSFRFVMFAHQGLTDVPALLFQLIAVHAFLRAESPSAWVGAWVAVGLAAMTKGPVAIIPVAIWVAFYVVRGEWSGLRRMRLLPGATIALAIAAPWPIYMTATHGRRFLDVIVLSEVVARVRGEVGGSRGLFYYADVWPADLLPWTPFFVAALGWLALAHGRLEPDIRRGVSLALVWFAGVILLFTLSKAKVPHYLLPSHPAAALLTGLFIARVARNEASGGMWRAATLVVLLLLPAAGVLAWALLRRAPDPAMALPAVLMPSLLALGTIAIAVSGRRGGPVAASVALAVTSATTAAYAALIVVPGLAGLQTVPQLAARITATAPPASRLGQYGVVSAGLVHYTRHRVDLLTSAEAAAGFLQAPGDAVLVLPRPDVPEIAALAPGAVHEIAAGTRLVLRLDRLFGDRSPFEDGLVALTNRPGMTP